MDNDGIDLNMDKNGFTHTLPGGTPRWLDGSWSHACPTSSAAQQISCVARAKRLTLITTSKA